ncbi:hypothetical protein KU43P_08410 [Pseudomonas sp. KU43P]|nr:hypothetical protein KU43P_08410 [Pseudomonas sp. KU43P]
MPERRKGAIDDAQPVQPTRHSEKGKEPSKGKPGSMPLHTVPCFKADKLPTFKHAEFERQLKGQQDGLNRLTIKEFLENIDSPVKRNPAIARRERKRFQMKLQKRLQKELMGNMGPEEAKRLSAEQAKETMASLAALHNPDLIAGGRDAISDFGDRQVNSTIGPQWKAKIQGLKRAAQRASQPGDTSALLNVRLHKC